MPDPRTYIKVHDGSDEHPKIEPLSDAAFRTLHRCWYYCSRQLTDGRLTDAAWRNRGSAKARRELVDAGLVHLPGHDCPHEDCPHAPAGHVQMHDYLEHQRSAAEVAEMREKRARAGSKGGKAKAAALADAVASATPVAKQTPGKNVTVSVSETEPSLRSGSAPNGAGRQRPQPRPNLRTVDANEDPTAQTLVAWYVDRHTRRPPGSVVGQVAKHVGALLAEGFEPDAIRRGLTELVRKSLNPSTLPSLVNEAANADPRQADLDAIRAHNAAEPWNPIALPDGAR